ncbi:MAG: efflux RND transporter periplasmic adaptor subunit [Nitrospiraceae bacterium]|nr:efflux RND transporter periplasmic adaptor subunit [Nitrospiraceae bacterium]
MNRTNTLLIVSGLLLMGGSFFLPRGGVVPSSATGAVAPRDGRVVAEGRLMACPDALATVRSEYAGAIDHYPAREHERVKKGDLLAELRATDVEAQLAESRAGFSVDQARLDLAKNDFHRAERLWKKRATSFAAYDSARKTLAMAKARAERGEADVQLTEAILAKTRILSPIDGMVVARYHNLGEYVKVGSRIATVADLSKTRVEAEVDEFDIGRVRVGEPARLRAEGMDKGYKGVVVSISERVTRKHLIPEDPSRPTDTGVVRVKIVSATSLPFKLGQKVDVRIDTTRTVPLPGNSEKTRCSGS